MVRLGEWYSTVLNDLVFDMTGFRPSGWGGGTALTVELEQPRIFSFESLSESEYLIEFSGRILISTAEPDLLTTLAAFVLEYTFTGKIRDLCGPNGDAMVEYGVSRFKQASRFKQVAQTDERLAILALVNVVKKKGLNLERYWTRDLNTSNAAYRGIVFEAFGPYLLARAFSVPTPLSKVFEFVGGGKANEALQDELAELVTLEKDGDDFQMTPLQIEKHHRSTTAADTLEWLLNPQGSAFCFPASTVGPDLMFVLRLTSDNTVLRVCVQFKYTENLSPQSSEKAIRTTDPSTFLSEKTRYSNSPTCSDPSMRDKMEEAIKNFGNGTKKAGSCGLLRVVISHPSLTDSYILEETAKGSHPLAVVPLSTLEPPESDLGQPTLFRQPGTPILERKRMGSDEIERARPKRQRKGTM